MEKISLGNWVTVTELGKEYGIGARRVREVLHHIGVLGPEGPHGRYRLSKGAVQRGLGKRFEAVGKRKYPFDVLSPEAQALIAQEWERAIQELAAEKNSSERTRAALRHFTEFQERRPSELQTQEQVHWY